jgi:threonine dehydratase
LAVSEAEVEAAIRFAFSKLRLVVEPGGAVALAAWLAGKVDAAEDLVIVLSGGNVDPRLYADILTGSGN